VALTFLLIFVGGHTTTAGAGMAFPDWPLSGGSVNPNQWWNDVFQRLEHGHRLIASLVGISVAVLCAGVWGRLWGVAASVTVGFFVAVLAKLAGFPGLIAHGALWGTVASFVLFLTFQGFSSVAVSDSRVRVLSLLAFVGVCVQAVLGGLRVTIESGGSPGVALVFRVIHGCFAQVELSLLVAVAVMLSSSYPKINADPVLRPVRKWLFVVLCALFVQLALGAAMRHRGAGLAISSFPAANPSGGWLPTLHTADVDLNYAHTRVGALIVAGGVVWVLLRLIVSAGGQRGLRRWAVCGLGLLFVQVGLGVSIIWYLRPLVPTTFHVLNGAALVAVFVLLTVRVSRSCRLVGDTDGVTERRMADGFAG
jgi:cytochrome c oxidase assembly protein subunit 15